jgi:hypothetical protein
MIKLIDKIKIRRRKKRKKRKCHKILSKKIIIKSNKWEYKMFRKFKLHKKIMSK